MVGPILGPTLGGWLTDNFSCRWVFFVNIPVGILSFIGIQLYIRETVAQTKLRFDVYGCVALSLAIGLLQMFLDRGELLDWFSSLEIQLEAAGALVSFVFLIALTATAQEVSFFNVQLLKDRNFVTGLVLYFMVGLLLYATRALLPPMLQSLMGYPVIAAGLVIAPSGWGTMVAMLFAGRYASRVDARGMIALGFALTAWSLWQMAGYTFDTPQSSVVWSSVIQGLGLGFVSVPLTTMTFSTRNTALFHSQMVEHVNLASPAVQAGLPAVYNLVTPQGLAALNNEVTRQASFLATLNGFKRMRAVTLLSMPLLLLMRKPSHAATPPVD